MKTWTTIAAYGYVLSFVLAGFGWATGADLDNSLFVLFWLTIVALGFTSTLFLLTGAIQELRSYR